MGGRHEGLAAVADLDPVRRGQILHEEAGPQKRPVHGERLQVPLDPPRRGPTVPVAPVTTTRSVEGSDAASSFVPGRAMASGARLRTERGSPVPARDDDTSCSVSRVIAIHSARKRCLPMRGWLRARRAIGVGDRGNQFVH